MTYDFETPIDRRNSDSLKWSVGENELPMWVADMDFYAAPEIYEAMKNRLEHGVFGYSVIGDEWYDAVVGWWRRRHCFELSKDWLTFCTGVVPAISSAIRKLTTPADNVLLQTPVYNMFFNSVKNNGRNVLESPLVYKDGEYSVDFKDLEDKLALSETTLMILCNPHNPIGKIWDRETLEKIGHLCKIHGVTVISDEIHCDITEPGCEYIPFASVSDECRDISVSCMAASKAFNIAGLHTAVVSVPNPFLRAKIIRALNTDEISEPNSFAVCAAVAAFNSGDGWLDAFREHIHKNRAAAGEFIDKNIAGIKLVKSEATYLLWLDCSEICIDATELQKFIREKTGLYVTAGGEYGESGRSFLRMNIACPTAVLNDGLSRLRRGVEMFKEKLK